ncbi:hypothetical protein ACS0TY_021072 [Phlomoides rotata]
MATIDIKDNTRIEKSLNTAAVKLDSRCITQVLERCAFDKSQLGVRFFVWAALHPSHRHTAYLYSKASYAAQEFAKQGVTCYHSQRGGQ